MSIFEGKMQHQHKELVPSFLVKAMFVLMLGTISMVAYAQVAGVAKTGVVQQAQIVESRSVVLIGDRTGRYTVEDPAGTVIASTADEKAGFIGVIGRVIDRERLVFGADRAAPITIARRQNGNIAVIDPSTNMSVELIGYGVDNIAAFAKLLN